MAGPRAGWRSRDQWVWWQGLGSDMCVAMTQGDQDVVMVFSWDPKVLEEGCCPGAWPHMQPGEGSPLNHSLAFHVSFWQEH